MSFTWEKQYNNKIEVYRLINHKSAKLLSLYHDDIFVYLIRDNYLSMFSDIVNNNYKRIRLSHFTDTEKTIKELQLIFTGLLL